MQIVFLTNRKDYEQFVRFLIKFFVKRELEYCQEFVICGFHNIEPAAQEKK